MDRKQIIEILRVGLRAPSPYNSQPWEFEHTNDQLLIYAKFLERGFLANFGKAVLFSLGALLENLSEGAKHYHFAMSYRLIGQSVKTSTPICEVTFHQLSNSCEHDITHVLARYTNRKKYSPRPVPDDVVKEIHSLYSNNNREIIDVTHNRVFIDTCSLLERVRISNFEFNEDLIDNLCLTPREAETRRRGLDLRVLELPAYATAFLRAERNTFFRRTIGRSLITQINAEKAKKHSLYSCPLLLAFKSNANTFEANVQDWMDIQKILNFLQRKGLCSHLEAASIDLTKVKRSFYSPSEQKILNQADTDIEKTLGFKMQLLHTLLRVGYAPECHFKSLRVDPERLFRSSPV